MCGILGLFLQGDAPPARAEDFGAFLTRLGHRGPDSHGCWMSADGRVALGHARLAILDLSPAGRQPMADAEGRFRITFNGEIYNYLELRRQLEDEGEVFRSHTDTEVLLALYRRRGEGMLESLRGVFAFAIHDARDGGVFCARDRIGKKPLVYAVAHKGVAVASEIPALGVLAGIDRGIDETALGLYLLRNLRHVPDPWTIFRGIRRLPPGHAMRIVDGRIGALWRWWRPRFDSRPARVDEVRAAIDDAVRLRLRADVPVAAFLSGGVDSTGIVATMLRQGTGGVATYAMGRDADDPELAQARRAALFLDTDHHQSCVDPARHLDHFDRLLRLHGDPVMLLPLLHAFELAGRMRADGYRVAMAGHGADELFYGYGGHLRQARLSRLLAFVPRPAAVALAHAAAPLPVGHAVREALMVASTSVGVRKAALYRHEAAHLLPDLIGAPAARRVHGAIGQWLGLWFEDGSPADYIDEAAVIGLMHENAHSVTIAADLPGMAAGVEMRCPFLDHAVVELAWRMDFRDKVAGGVTKKVLKQALADRVPADILGAPKRGFGYYTQEADILRGPWKSAVDDAFARDDDLDGLLDPDGMRRLKARFDSGGPVPAQLIAKLFALLRWRQLGDPC